MGAEPDQDDGGELLAGRYEVGPLVGMGGTARVYRAWDRHRGRPVAVKIFRPGSTPSPGDGGARELKVLGGVSHPGVVGVQGRGVDAGGCPFVVMDFVDGQSLAARLHDGPLPVGEVTRLGVVLADALAVVHGRGVVHRDVKPANVLLDTGGRPWLTDFGIARIVDATQVTATGIVVGTAAYMAPEQVRGEAVGPPADVYALGLVLLEAVTGRREYEGNALESALARLHRAPVVPAGVPDPLATLLRGMTALDPDARPTAVDVAAVLREPPAAATVMRRPATRRAAPFAALACLVAGALAGGLALTGAQSPGEPRAAVVAAAPPVVPPAVLPSVTETGAPPDALAAPADPPPVPVAVTRGKNTPTPGRSAPVRPRAAARGDDRADDPSDDRQRDDRRGDDARDDGDDHGSDARDDDGDENDTDKGGKSGKGEGGKAKKKDDDGGNSHGKGGRSGSNSGKG